jgi:hypothetical protein
MTFSKKQKKTLLRYVTSLWVPSILGAFVIFKEGRILGYSIIGITTLGLIGLAYYLHKKNDK